MGKSRLVSATLFLFVVSLLFSCGQGTQPDILNSAQIPKPEPERKASFLAVGDIMLSRGVAAASDRAGSAEYPFSLLKNEFLTSDFNFGNLESPVSGNDKRIGKGLIFNARRDHARALAAHKFTVVNLANNHAMDQLFDGLKNTRAFLDEIGVKYMGTGTNLDEAWTPAVVEANGIKIGFVGASYASINDGGVARNDYVARVEDVDRLRAAIAKARAASDLVVATMHAGVEYVRKPDKTQIEFAQAAIDAGADVVIGAHPHWVQTIDEYKGRPIFYSLGNFIFDQPWPDTRTGLMLRISVRKGGDAGPRAVIDSIELLPIMIENRSVPRLANSTEAENILRKIGATERVVRPRRTDVVQ